MPNLGLSCQRASRPYRRLGVPTPDALWLAVYAKERRPAPSLPTSYLAQSLTRELRALDKDLTRLKNRLEAAEAGEVHPGILASLRRRIEMLQQEERALEEQLERDTKESHGHELTLLTSIPGIGTRTACHLLAEIGDVHRFASARKLVAFAGLAPARFESGTSIGGYTKISRLGSSSLRRLLYMPCLSAIRFNPVIKAFFEKLVNRNKPRKAAVIACMAKLLKIAYGVLTSDRAFKANPAPAWQSTRHLHPVPGQAAAASATRAAATPTATQPTPHRTMPSRHATGSSRRHPASDHRDDKRWPRKQIGVGPPKRASGTHISRASLRSLAHGALSPIMRG